MNISGFANGGYACKCKDCGSSFIDDKRAFRCAKCAKSKEPILLFLDSLKGRCELATHPRTQHMYDKYAVLVSIGAEEEKLLHEMQQLGMK